MGLLALPDGVREQVIVHYLTPSDAYTLSLTVHQRPFRSQFYACVALGGVKRERSMAFVHRHLEFCSREHQPPMLLSLDLSGADLSSSADLGEVLERCVNVRVLRLVGCSLLQPQVTTLSGLFDPK
jgi:hypothetical protein